MRNRITMRVFLVLAMFWSSGAFAQNGNGKLYSITDFGAVGNGTTLNTKAIQTAIEKCAAGGGGTVVIPAGQFLSGAIILEPRVNLQLDKDAVLLGSTNIDDYPTRPTRIEGHTEPWPLALVNASHADGLRITGSGTIQGGGKFYWDLFWKRFNADKKTQNLDVPRPRNIFIEDSKGVLISGISLRGSGFWNIHLYRCQQVIVEKVDIRTPPRSPSTDGIDIDSSQDVTIRGCYISVSDDNIALKGNKGPFAEQDKSIPAVEHIRIFDCTFGFGHGVVTLGSEACHVRDVVVENCTVEGAIDNRTVLVRLKLRPDTPQHYEDIHFNNIKLNCKGEFISIAPWTTYFNLQGQPPPSQLVENVTVSNITGYVTSFGKIAGPNKSLLRNITLKNVNLKLGKPGVTIKGVEGLTVENVKFNGVPYLPDPGASKTPAVNSLNK